MPLFQPTAIFRGVEHITPEYLKENGITALILDVDNTLTGHGSQVLPEKVAEWIKTMKRAGIGLVIASNNFEKRVAPFAQRIGLRHCAFCCKPSPFGIARARKHIGVSKESVALVGDQIFTDALGANLYGITMLLVEPMYRNETWSLRLKRVLEAPILKKYYEKGGKLL